MRKLVLLVAAALCVIGVASTATAGTSNYAGTLTITIGDLPDAVLRGMGVATTNGGAGGTHISTLTLPAGDIAGSTIVPVTDPEGTQANGIIQVRLTATKGAGTLGGIGATEPVAAPLATASNTLALSGGLVRLCLFLPDCSLNLPLALAGAGVGLGVGGQQTIGGSGSVRVSIDHAPWTILTATAIDQPDNTTLGTVTSAGVGCSPGTGCNFTLQQATGSIHGPASASSSAALGTINAPGIVQFVTPSQATTNITATSSTKIAVPGILRFGFVPEPGLLLLLVSGVAGLAAVGRSRMRK